MLILGYILAVVVGVSLGLIGSGGSILTVPILVYLLHIEPTIATGYSLFIVGTAALVGGLRQLRSGNAHLKTVLLFGIPSVVVVLLIRSLVLPNLPDHFAQIGSFEITKSMAILVFFSLVMLRAAYAMIRPCQDCSDTLTLDQITYPMGTLIIQGVLVGVVSGFVGAGGGFLIIPVLVVKLKMPMKIAVGSSMFIIAINALIGFLGDYKHFGLFDWQFLLLFTACAILGILIGIFIASKIDGSKLKLGLGYFVLVMAVYILLKEIVLT